MRKGSLDRKLAEQEKAKKAGKYLRWFHTRDMPGAGTKTRLACEKSASEELHLMSEAELAVFLEAWWRPSVVTICDQHALDRKKTQRAAALLSIDHPTYSGRGEPAVLSTDLVLFTRHENSYGREALSVKWAPSGRKRSLTPLQEIERKTWEDDGVTYRAVTAHGMHGNRSKNLAWIYRAANDMVGRDLSEQEVAAQREFHRLIRRRRPMSVLEAARHVDSSLALLDGSGVRAFRQLAGIKRIRFDLDATDPLLIRLENIWCCPKRKALTPGSGGPDWA
jgi:hypothetical protein